MTINKLPASTAKVKLRNGADSADIDPLAESTFTATLGAVTASPTANTVLDRLKALLTGISLAAGSAVIGAVTQSGTWTVQPGNTANTTAWKVDGSAVTQPVSLASVPSHAVTNAGTFATQAAAAGDVAHDAVDSGNPSKIGMQARTTDPTAVASADRVNAIADTLGKQVVLPGAVHDRTLSGRANFTNTTAADIIAAQGAGIRIVVTQIAVSNAHATVGTKVEIRDGTTVKISMQAAGAGGGWVQAGGYPLFLSTANTAVTARCVTTGADVEVNISGYTISN